MKLSKRETIMVIAIVFFLLIAGFWFVLLSPAQDALALAQAEYDIIKGKDEENESIINSVSTLNDTLNELKINVSTIEDSLLPELDNEVIVEHLANIFVDHGLQYITEITSDPIITDNLLLSDGSYSQNSVQWVRINLKISGTDGVTEGGIPAVGYEEFIEAVKEIEDENPTTIHISSISMEDSDYGFQYFLISVDVFAFNLPNRISSFDATEPYIVWDRELAEAGGIFGIPYADVQDSLDGAIYFKPFATVQAADVTNSGTTEVTLPIETTAQDVLTPTLPAA